MDECDRVAIEAFLNMDAEEPKASSGLAQSSALPLFNFMRCQGFAHAMQLSESSADLFQEWSDEVNQFKSPEAPARLSLPATAFNDSNDIEEIPLGDSKVSLGFSPCDVQEDNFVDEEEEEVEIETTYMPSGMVIDSAKGVSFGLHQHPPTSRVADAASTGEDNVVSVQPSSDQIEDLESPYISLEDDEESRDPLLSFEELVSILGGARNRLSGFTAVSSSLEEKETSAPSFVTPFDADADIE